MKKDDFIEKYCKKSKITKEELLSSKVVLKCSCEYKECSGWEVVSDNEMAIKAHNELYR